MGGQANGTPGAPGRRRFIRNSRDKAKGSRFTLGQAFRCAAAGIAHAFRTQRNMKIHLAFAVAALLACALLAVEPWGWCAVIGCIAAVMAAECLNTAIEAVVDLVTDDYHELARIAKDCAAGAVYLCAIGSVAIGLVVFVPALAALLAPAA